MMWKLKSMRWQWHSSLIAIVLLVVSPTVLVYGQILKFNQKHSRIEFEISHLGVLTVNGDFKVFSGSMIKVKEGWDINGTIEVKSVDTTNPERDETVLGKQYLDAGQFPKIEFKGKAVESKKHYLVNGFLSIRGVTKSISFLLAERQSGFSGELSISRKFFDLDFGGMDDLIGDEIIIVLLLLPEEQNKN